MIVTVVIGILVVAGLFASGLLPRLLEANGPGTTGPPTFSTAQGAANSAASGYDGHGWSDTAGVALAMLRSTALPRTEFDSIAQASGCAITWDRTAPSIVTVPPTAPNASAGAAAFWLFLYSDQKSASLLLVSVTNFSAQPLFVATGGNCSILANLPTLAGYTIVDSSVAVSAADAKGGSSFLLDHPEANRTWLVHWNLSTPTWSVVYSSCPIPPPANRSVSARVFSSTVNADDGTAITGGNTTAVCSLPISFTLPRATSATPSSGLPWGSMAAERAVPSRLA